MKNLFLCLVLVATSCSTLQQQRAQEVLDAKTAVCRVAEYQDSADEGVAAVQKLCKTDATLKQIAAQYAGSEACPAASVLPGTEALPAPTFPEISTSTSAAPSASASPSAVK